MESDRPARQAGLRPATLDEMTVDQRIAEAVRIEKSRSGMTQAQIGEGVARVMLRKEGAIHQTVVGSWLRGKSTPSVEQLLALDQVFGVPAGWLLWKAGLLDVNRLGDAIDEEYGTSTRAPRRFEEAIAQDTTLDDEARIAVLRTLVDQRRGATDRLAMLEEQLKVATAELAIARDRIERAEIRVKENPGEEYARDMLDDARNMAADKADVVADLRSKVESMLPVAPLSPELPQDEQKPKLLDRINDQVARDRRRKQRRAEEQDWRQEIREAVHQELLALRSAKRNDPPGARPAPGPDDRAVTPALDVPVWATARAWTLWENRVRTALPEGWAPPYDRAEGNRIINEALIEYRKTHRDAWPATIGALRGELQRIVFSYVAKPEADSAVDEDEDPMTLVHQDDVEVVEEFAEALRERGITRITLDDGWMTAQQAAIVGVVRWRNNTGGGMTSAHVAMLRHELGEWVANQTDQADIMGWLAAWQEDAATRA